MNFELNDQQKEIQQQARSFCKEVVAPNAGDYDKQEKLPQETINAMAKAGFLGCLSPKSVGGTDYDMISFGLLNEEIGRGCSSVRSLITVHSMVQYAILKWGSAAQQARWLPEIASGSKLAAFALSEPEVGSDAASIRTKATADGQDYLLNGHKKWISFGQIANVYLVFAQVNGKPIACLVDRNTQGLSVEPIHGMMGCKASMLAHVHFKDCRIAKTQVLGGKGFGFSAIALSALDIGRYSVASGSVGIAKACIHTCTEYVDERKQFGQPLGDFQLIRRHLTNMHTQTVAARLLYYHCAYLKEKDEPTASTEIMRAKYYAGVIANDVTRSAVQILGAQGYCDQYPLERYFRDAKAMEIIEGSNEMLQLVLGTGDSS